MDNKSIQIDETRLMNLPNSLIKAELDGLYGSKVLEDMYHTLRMYDIYEHGSDYTTDSNTDYTPANLRYKTTKALIDKEARFLFAKSPDFYVEVDTDNDGSVDHKSDTKEVSTVFQDLIDRVLSENSFPGSLLKAAKDCFISKRVALIFNINEEDGIQISFLPSLEFVYDVDSSDVNKLTKLVAFYGLNDEKSRTDQRIYKKKYWLDNGFCYYSEAVYNGLGQLVEEIQTDTKTKFSYIPAYVIVNDGLTGDLLGVSEVDQLADYESWYSRLAAADMDAERKGMNPIRYTVDASPDSTKGLSIAAGAFWDLSSDQTQAVDKSAQVGVLDSPMTYSSALTTTLERIKNTMYEQCAVPNVSPEALKGVVSSGKTLKAIYWDLIVRCEEKMLSWRPALQFLGKCIIEGVKLYPNVGKKYLDKALPETKYSIRVENQYPLLEDESEEKQVDLMEVTAQTMSKKSYMKKWRNLTDDEANAELQQIALERQLLEDAFTEPIDYAVTNGENTEPESENEPEDNSKESNSEDKGKSKTSAQRNNPGTYY